MFISKTVFGGGYPSEGDTVSILVCFDLVGFCDIPTIVGYSMPNPLYTFLLNI